MVETLHSNPEFEQNIAHEIEQKFLPIFPEKLAEFRETARPIEQFYLSHPCEDFSLRLRETFADDGTLRYSATLKDRGKTIERGLDRLEIETEISPELYQFYRVDAPVIRKLRAEPNRKVMIDFYEDGHMHLEAEDPIAWTQFTDQHGDAFVDVTGDRMVDNEFRAHLTYRKEHEGQEAFAPTPELDVTKVAHEIFELYCKQSPIIVKINGRSGSGKSTIVRKLQTQLTEFGITSEVISTDDYHRGASWLRAHNNGVDWSEWDHPIVYDTEAMAHDIDKILQHQAIPKRTIDFTTVEPTVQGEVQPAPVLIIEGIYSKSADLARFNDCSYEVPTPLATCAGRRILRDIKSRPQFTPESNLRYILEQAEPMWRTQSV